MAERPTPPSAQEAFISPEQREVMRKNWEVIESLTPRTSRVTKFAKAVLKSSVLPEDFNLYLGERDWKKLHDHIFDRTVGFVGEWKEEIIPGHRKRFEALNKAIPLAQGGIKVEKTNDDLLVYAKEESSQIGSTTINWVGRWLDGREASGWYWSRIKRGWYERYVSKEWVHRESAPWGYRDHDMAKWTRDWLGKHTHDASVIAKRFLLDPNTDIKMIKHKSPGELVNLARSQADEVVLRTGLRWEQPIPPAA